MFGWLPIIYYMRIRSIPEYFERRFNSSARYLATFMTLIFMIGYIAIQFLTLATVLYRIFGIPLMAAVIIIAIATTIYMHFGGQTSVIFTDLFQGLILIFAGLLLFYLGINFLEIKHPYLDCALSGSISLLSKNFLWLISINLQILTLLVFFGRTGLQGQWAFYF